MKKVFLYMIMAAVVITSGCSSFVEDYNVSPNSPSEMTPALLLSNAQVGLFAAYGGQFARMSAMWTQQMEGVDAQMLTYGTDYDYKEGDVTNEWDLLYSETLDAAVDLVDNHGADNSHYAALGKICQAMAFGIATDFWGSVPMEQACKGAEFLNPAYNTQEQVITGIQKLLDDAITALGSAPTGTAPSGDDLIFGGDADMWIKTANSLKARYAMRLSEVPGSNAAANALAVLDDAISSSAEDCNAVFGTAGNEQNTWMTFDIARPQYIAMAEGFVDAMVLTADPRLAYYSGVDTGGAYRGAAAGSGDQTASPVGSYLKGTSLPMVSYVETMFIKAEAHFLNSEPSDAADAYNEAVKASILQVTGSSDPVYEGLFASETGSTITHEKIMLSKYAAMFGHIEAFSDWRRTGIPALTPQPGAQVSSVPVRFPFPIEERLYNTSAPSSRPAITDPVWWDQ